MHVHERTCMIWLHEDKPGLCVCAVEYVHDCFIASVTKMAVHALSEVNQTRVIPHHTSAFLGLLVRIGGSTQCASHGVFLQVI